MPQNIGTLITSTIRPNNSLDPISVIYTNEAKGGHHVYATLAEMYSIISDRRDFGMLVTIYNDTIIANNKTYQLRYGYSSTSVNDNNNWVIFSNNNSSNNNEWQNSVLSRTSSIPLANVTGNRYLIIGNIPGTSTTPSENTWVNHVDNIAEYDSTIPTWNFTIPSEGMTVRVDNEKDILYKYSGTYASGGSWNKEYLNQIYSLTASSVNGINFIANANLFTYSKPSVMYVQFMTSSSATTATININNLGTVYIKKITGNNLLDISNNDLVTGIEYQLIWDGVGFQTPLSSSINQIGLPEFGNTYSNGVYNYPSFTPSTPVGTAVDRFNQLLSALMPPSAPNLLTIGAFSATYAIGKLSFPSSSVGSNFNSAISTYGSVGLDGLWNIGMTADGGIYRLGVYSGNSGNNFNTDLFGYLNYNIATNSSTPTPAYIAKSFGDATTGALYMSINGFTVSTLSLTSSYNAIDNTSSMTFPGLSVSAATNSKFPNGGNFDLYYNRIGLWYIPKVALQGPYSYNSSIGLTANSYGVTRGYNSLTINHYRNGNNITNKIEFIVDDDNSTLSATNPNATAFNNFLFTGSKQISGISYHNSLALQYTVTINNLYSKVYSNRTDAVIISDCTPSGLGFPRPILGTNSFSVPAYSTINYSGLLLTQNYNYSNSSNVRRINDSISSYVSTVYKPLSPTFLPTPSNGGSASLVGIVMDTVVSTATSLLEDFAGEAYRLQSGVSYDTVFSVTSNPFNSTTSLLTDTASLQIMNGRLQYPTLPFNTYGSLATNLNYGLSSTNYSSATGVRTYYRYFYMPTTTIVSSSFVISITGTGSIVNSTTTLSGDQFSVQMKMPLTGTPTGWMDISNGFNVSTFTGAEHDGIYNASYGQPVNLNGIGFGLLVGTKNTSASGGYVVFKITAPQGWTGNLQRMQITYL